MGHRHSLLTVVERIHRYFAAGDADARDLPASDDPERFARIVSQYLLFYSASATPADYAALADGSLTAVRVHGILRYRDFATLGELQRAVQAIRDELPREWRIAIAGPARELIAHGERLRRNWLSSLAASAVLIFVTVLAVFRNLREALLSLVPAAAVLVAVAGLAPGFGVRIDDYTVIALAITLGLTVDYTIHVLNALHHAAAPAGSHRRTAVAGVADARAPAAGLAAAWKSAAGQPAAGQPAAGQPAAGNLPPDNLPPDNLPPDNLPPTTAPDNLPPDNLPPTTCRRTTCRRTTSAGQPAPPDRRMRGIAVGRAAAVVHGCGVRCS